MGGENRREALIAFVMACAIVASCSAGPETVTPPPSPSPLAVPATPPPIGTLAYPDDPIGYIDQPEECTRVSTDTVRVSGWAIDRNAKSGTGVDNVSLYVDGAEDKGSPIGVAEYGNPHGAGPMNGGDPRFLPSGWTLVWTSGRGSPIGHVVYAVMHSSVTGRTTVLKRLIGRTQPCWHEPIGSIDQPAEGAALIGGAVELRGWAADRDAVSGSGVAGVDLFLDGCPGAGIPLGRAKYGEPRPDVASYFSMPELGSSGWSYRWITSGLSPGPHTVYAVLRSAVHAQTTTIVRTFGGPPDGFVGCFDASADSTALGELVDLSGWAIDRGASNGASDITSVTLSAQDSAGKITSLGSAVLGKPRPDVALHPAADTAGWTYTWDTAGLSRGRYTVKALVAGKSGETTTLTRRVELAPLFGQNVARRRPASASNAWGGNAPGLAFDGDGTTAWNSGDYPPQWIEVDLGEPIAIARIRLIVAQFPNGRTVHRVLGRAAEGSYRELKRFEGLTSAGQSLEWTPTLWVYGIQFLRVETIESPSWVAWSEIEVYLAAPLAPAGTRVTGKLLLPNGAPAAKACVQIGADPACVTETDADGAFAYDFDPAALAAADWTFTYKVDGVAKGSQTLGKGSATGSRYALPTYTLQL